MFKQYNCNSLVLSEIMFDFICKENSEIGYENVIGVHGPKLRKLSY